MGEALVRHFRLASGLVEHCCYSAKQVSDGTVRDAVLLEVADSSSEDPEADVEGFQVGEAF